MIIRRSFYNYKCILISSLLNLHVVDKFIELQAVNSLGSLLGHVDPLNIKGLEEHEAYQVQPLAVVNALSIIKRQFRHKTITLNKNTSTFKIQTSVNQIQAR